MNTSLRKTIGLTFTTLLLLLLAVPVAAQEDESGGDDEGWGKILVDIGMWGPEPGGFGDQVTSIGDPFGSTGLRTMGFPSGIIAEPQFRVGAELARDVGRLTLSQFKHTENSSLMLREPGNFIFGELLAFPLYAGLGNDGLADAVNAGQRNELKETRIEYSRTAFSNSRVSGRWTAGVRRVNYGRTVGATYFALAPSFPAFVPPLTTGLPNLVPIADTVAMSSTFEGGGLSAGMEFQAPLGTDKFIVEAGVNIALLVGDVQSNYTSENSFYTLTGVVLEAPYSELADFVMTPSGGISGTAASVVQETTTIAVGTDSSSVTSQVYEISLGGRWRALNFMDVFLGYRSAHYANVVSEIRPTNVIVSGTSTINAVNASRTDRSVTYEGFYGGLGFRF